MDKEYILKKWLAGELTDEELATFKKSEDFELNAKIIEGAKKFKASQFSTVRSYDEFKNGLKNKKSPLIRLNSYKTALRIAALFVISLGIYFAFLASNVTTVQTVASQKTTFELPDASSVVLNANSTAKYNKKKWADKREISLDGEAFFKVAKGATFDVITTNGTISVLGTQFNVKNRADYFQVTCFEGIVSVKSHREYFQLTQGKTIRIIDGTVVTDTIGYKKPRWIDNKSSFKSVPLYEVLNEFERQYNVTITTQNIDTKRLFTGGFVHDNIDQALTTITVPFDLTFKKENLTNITLYSSE